MRGRKDASEQITTDGQLSQLEDDSTGVVGDPCANLDEPDCRFVSDKPPEVAGVPLVRTLNGRGAGVHSVIFGFAKATDRRLQAWWSSPAPFG